MYDLRQWEGKYLGRFVDKVISETIYTIDGLIR